MPKIVVVPLSLCVDTQLQRSIDAFAALGVSKFFMLRKWLSLNKLFNHYRNGEFTTAQFINEISKIYPSVDFSHGRFESAWNAQTLVTERTLARFQELEDLEKAGVEVYLFSTTNALHHHTIVEQYGKAIPGTPYFSYQHHQSGSHLLTDLLKTLKAKYPALKKEEVSVLYSRPGSLPSANWGYLGWLRAPFQRWEHRQATNYVSGLERQASTNQFTLNSCDFSKQNAVKEILEQKGWFKNSPLDEISLDTKPRFNAHYSLRSHPKPVVRLNVETSLKKKTSLRS